MRRMGVILLVALAQPAAAAALDHAQLEDCKGYSKVAGHMMQSRQDGERMADMMEMASKVEGFEAIAQAMVTDAYKEPRRHSEEQRQMAVVDFENQIYAACIEKHRQSNSK